MTVLRNITFQGLSVSDGRVGGPRTAEQLRAICEDQALVYERLTNKNADQSGGAPAVGNEGHDHTEAGNLLYWPLLTQVFGSEGYAGDRATTGFNYFGDKPATIECATDTAEASGVVAWYVPLFVPPGWADRYFSVRLVARPDPSMQVTLESAVGTTAGGNAGIPLRPVDYGAHTPTPEELDRDRDVYEAVIVPPSAGVFALKFTTNTEARHWHRQFYELSVTPKPEQTATSVLPERPTTETSNLVVVGDPEDANAFHPVQSTLVHNDGAYGTALTLAAHNDALLQEMATGLAAAGQANATVAGHNHSGTGVAGLEVSYCAGAWPFGRASSSATTVNAAFLGNGFDAPCVAGTTYRAVRHMMLRTHASANTSAAASKLRFAVLGYNGDDKGAVLRVRITTAGQNPATAGVVYTLAAGVGYHLATGTTGHAHAGGGYTSVLVEIAESTASGYASACLAGVCAYFDRS